MKISLGQQIDALRMALSHLAHDGDRLTRAGSLKKNEANYQRARLQAALNTLEWLDRNEAAVKAAVKEG